jgi:hypothetical protein
MRADRGERGFARDLPQRVVVSFAGTVRGTDRKTPGPQCASANIAEAATEVRSNNSRLRAISRARKERSRGQWPGRLAAISYARTAFSWSRRVLAVTRGHEHPEP